MPIRVAIFLSFVLSALSIWDAEAQVEDVSAA